MSTKVQDFLQSNLIPEERFLPITNFEGRFWISDHGRIMSHDHRKDTISFLNPAVDGPGYYNTQLRMKPINKRVRVHVLVGEHFCEMVPVYGHRMVWNHKDGNKLNNHYTNIEYVTMLHNSQHAVRTGLFDRKGVKHHNVKITEEMVLQMRQMRKEGMIYKDIAIKFGIGRRHAADVVNGVCWGWLV